MTCGSLLFPSKPELVGEPESHREMGGLEGGEEGHVDSEGHDGFVRSKGWE